MEPVLRLENTIQPYAWGSLTAIWELLGHPERSGSPAAELWMGAHPNAPSIVMQDRRPLTEWIADNPKAVLGGYTAEKFRKLPFLFKVLAAGEPLSIQAHPDKTQAEAGFAREEQEGIPMSAYNRTYKDDNHKPEIICALTSFTALNGFLPAREIKTLLKGLDSPFLKEEIAGLSGSDEGLKALFSALMTMESEQSRQLTALVLQNASGKSDLKSRWLLKLNDFYPGDPGILCAALLNIITLNPGEAMYLPACRLHAYLEGTGIELMANSDNVLRGGLTPKYIDVPEMLSILDFRSSTIEVLKGKPAEGRELFLTPIDEFRLARIPVTAHSPVRLRASDSAAIWICTRGSGTLSYGDTLPVKQGDSLFITPACGELILSGDMELFEATVP